MGASLQSIAARAMPRCGELRCQMVQKSVFQEKSTKIDFLGPETAQRGRGVQREGVGATKIRSLPRKFFQKPVGKQSLSPGAVTSPARLAWMSRTLRGVHKVCAKKSFVLIPFPVSHTP